MARLLTPKLLLRGFELFLVASLPGLSALTLLYGNDSRPSWPSSRSWIHWPWLPGGPRRWRRWTGSAAGSGSGCWPGTFIPSPSLKGMILAGGMGAWAGYLTPLQSGAGPMMMYTMRRYGVPLPVAVTSTLMTFIATIAFFAHRRPARDLLRGRQVARDQRGNVLGLSLYDLFLGSLGICRHRRAGDAW